VRPRGATEGEADVTRPELHVRNASICGRRWSRRSLARCRAERKATSWSASVVMG
jgi:hypothetical protein